MLRFAIGSDHRGFLYKQSIVDAFGKEAGYVIVDVGSYDETRTDFPIYACAVVDLIKNKEVDVGVLLCSSGIGMAIAANRFDGIYAGVVWNELLAKQAKEDDNINVLVLPSDYITHDQVIPIVKKWLHSSFRGGRYAERIAMIDSMNDIITK